MNKIIYLGRVLIYLYGFFVFGLLCLLSLPLGLPLALLPLSWRRRIHPYVRHVVYQGFRFVRWHCRITGFVTMTLFDHRQGPKSRLLIANHISMFDIVMLFGLIDGVQSLVHAKFAQNPLLWSTVRAASYIPIDPKKPIDGVRAFEELEYSLREGQTVALFPEGTRSGTGSLGRLKMGPFRLASDLKIVPDFIFFTSNQAFLNPAAFFPRSRGGVRLEAHLVSGDQALLASDEKSWQDHFLKTYSEFVRSERALPWNRPKDASDC
ncbi:MAG: 1-acyl-sn-glycerol-3-phosphate acyltransferase [Proteobacteria bacterium]|nr:MAG: 1-acyl-sn-glycerol-3-phosphate acyltransferase [Pseudomonadota bacterium]